MSPAQGKSVPHTDFSDPAQIAVVFTELSGVQNSLALTLAEMSRNNGSIMQSMQSQLHDIAKSLERVALLQQEQKNHSQGLERLSKEHNDFVQRAHQEDLERKAEEALYRSSVKEEQTIFRSAAAAESQVSRDKMMRFSGGAAMFSALVFVIVSMVVYTYQSEKGNTAGDIDLIRERQMKIIESTDRRLDNVELALTKLCEKQGVNCSFQR